MQKARLQQLQAQGAASDIQQARTMRNLGVGRLAQRSMLGRELEYIRSTREGAQIRKEQASARLAGLQADRTNLEAQLKTETDANKRTELQGQLNLKDQDIANANKELQNANEIVNRFPPALEGWQAAFNATGQVAMSFATRLVTQVFRKALQEAKNFVKQFDAQMTQIQMVTLKTDTEISTLGDGFIQKAIDLKASIADVTTAATALYRQGLNDEEVDSRLDDILKFTRVGNVKAEDATKLATVAVNGGMVSSAMDAFNVVAAISDNAATDAAAITKGLQKSMYAAKSVGVGFDELVSMLAVITSKTQLSGQVAGTTMASVFSRMSRLQESDVVYDENGNATSRSSVATALHHAGVELYENGKMRSGYQILSDLGNVWGGLGDEQKYNISYLLGGGRQASNLQALMEGFTEVDESGRRLIDTYLELASASDGLVDEKNAVYMQSLAAAMNDVKNSFDAIVQAVASGGLFTDLAEGLAGALQGIATFAGLLDGAVGKVMALGGAIAFLAPILKMLFAGPLAALLPVLGVGALVLGGAAAVGAGINAWRENTEYNSAASQQRRTYDAMSREASQGRSAYETASSIVERNKDNWNDMSSEDKSALQGAMASLRSLGMLDTEHVSMSLNDLTESASAASTALAGVKPAIEEREKNAGLADFAAATLDLNDALARAEEGSAPEGRLEKSIWDTAFDFALVNYGKYDASIYEDVASDMMALS